MRDHKSLYLVTLDPEEHKRTCNYWFCVLSDGMSHTAFTKRESLLQYLRERGLELTEPLADIGTHSTQRINGTYRERAHLSYDEFFALHGERIKVMSNAQYTVGIVTQDEDGIRTVHSLNPNCHDRPVFDYLQTREAQG